MPVKNNRQYRSLFGVLQPIRRAEGEPSYRVEGYAATFDHPYVLFDIDDTQYSEQIDRRAFEGADMSDVIMQYNHGGRVLARNSNGTLSLDVDDHGLFISADLSKTAEARALYEDIAAGMITEMSWAFTENERAYDKQKHLWTVRKVRKVYDVSAVSRGANPETEIAARSLLDGVIQAEKRESFQKRLRILKLKIALEEK